MTTKNMLNRMADISGFRGIARDGGGVWYVSFLIDSPFWQFLGRNARSSSFERPTYGIGDYTFQNSRDIDKTLSWLIKEHKKFLSTLKDSNKKGGR